MHNFKQLKIWQKSIDLVTHVYQLTSTFPSSELYGLSSQIQRSATSIPSNIAEGSARGSDKELIRFLNIANGSAAELETQLIISEKLGFIKQEQLNTLVSSLQEINKMNYTLRLKFKTK